MIRQLRIQNFKAWRDTRPIRLAPLTVFFGTNSSGKSSINHFLMMLRQTVMSPDRNSVFDFGDENSAVRLGGFREAVYSHDLERQMKFEIEWELPVPMSIWDPKNKTRFRGDRISFHSAAGQAEGARIVNSEGFQYSITDDDSESSIQVGLQRGPEARRERWTLEANGYELVRAVGRAWELPKPVQFFGFPPQASVYFQNTGFLADIELSLEELIRGISYLGPLRSPPKRLYSWAGAEPDSVGWQGENTIQALLAAGDRKVNMRPKAKLRPLAAIVAEWLQKMELVHSFSVEPIARDRDEYEVRVRVSRSSDEVKLTDVGFGISQVLPVLVQAFYAPPHSTVLMEQPEIHLHPAVQSHLADVLIASVNARENGSPRGTQLIVESHSEHLLRRLQRRIAEEELTPEDVALYFCHPGPNGSVIDPLEIDSYGEILNWPPDFFGDELEDVSVQVKAGMQRKLNL